MTRSEYKNIILRLQEITSLISDIKLANGSRLNAVLEKYKSSEFEADLQTLLTARSAFQKILVKYTTIKAGLLRQLSRASVIEEEEVQEEIPVKKKSKKKKNKNVNE